MASRPLSELSSEELASLFRELGAPEDCVTSLLEQNVRGIDVAHLEDLSSLAAMGLPAAVLERFRTWRSGGPRVALQPAAPKGDGARPPPAAAAAGAPPPRQAPPQQPPGDNNVIHGAAHVGLERTEARYILSRGAGADGAPVGIEVAYLSNVYRGDLGQWPWSVARERHASLSFATSGDDLCCALDGGGTVRLRPTRLPVPPSTRTVITIGNPGVGKSWLCDFLLRELGITQSRFKSGLSAESVTAAMQMEVTEHYRIVDVPGLRDLDKNMERNKRAIVQGLSQGGPYFIVLVLRTVSGRLTADDLITAKAVCQCCGARGEQIGIIVNQVMPEHMRTVETFADLYLQEISKATGLTLSAHQLAIITRSPNGAVNPDMRDRILGLLLGLAPSEFKAVQPIVLTEDALREAKAQLADLEATRMRERQRSDEAMNEARARNAEVQRAISNRSKGGGGGGCALV